MKPAIYEKEMIIPHYLTDRYGRVNLQDLMNVFIEVSGEQTAQLDMPDISERGLRWIITQYNIQIERMPKASEKVRIRTFIEEHNRIFTYREFELYDKNDELLVHVLTVFALMNDKRKLSRIPSDLAEGIGSKESKRIRRLKRPELPEINGKKRHKNYQVGYYDIDSNFHANNSMYFIWMLETLGDEFLSRHDIVEGNIIYEKEIYMDEEVESYFDFTIDENEDLLSRHQIKVDGISKAYGNFLWRTNEVDYEADQKNLKQKL
ncbi:MAG: thioesterase [Atopostipes sp.]|nr:thioesterase [Atopostipes sp.]